MKLLILGFSDFVQRRIINILIQNFKDLEIGIASQTNFKKIKYKNIKWFKSYSDSINLFSPDIVYISLPNSKHFFWAKYALKKKINVIVDKPITLNFKNLKELINLSKKNKKILAEATIFYYHNQIKEAIKRIGGLEKILQVNSNFCIPKPSDKNIKLSNYFGGGVNNDMGPYAAASFRVFFKKYPKKIFVTKNKNNDVITTMNILATNGSKNFLGHFSFGKEYKNEIEIFSDRKILTVNSAFSPNPNLSTTINMKYKNVNSQILISKQSSFLIFFKLYLKNVKEKKFNYYYKDMIYDSKFREIINTHE